MDNGLPPALEEALFQRLLQRLIEAGRGLTPGTVPESADTAASRSFITAEAVEAAGDLLTASNAGDYIQKHGIEALSALRLIDHPGVSGPVTVAAAQKIVESRRNKKESIAQLLFRVPEHLRDDVKRLAVDEKRQMDELLTEAVLDLLLKHGRMPKAFQKGLPA